MTSTNPNLDPALKVLKDAGHNIGSASIKDGEMHLAIDGVPKTYEQIFQMVEDEQSKPKPGRDRTGK